MKRIIREYFTFNRKEQRGIVVLSVLLLLVIIIRVSLPYLKSKRNYDFSELEKQTKIFTAAPVAEKKAWKNYDKAEEKYTLTPFEFNPNVMGYDDWQSLGLPENISTRLVKYANKGGKFRSKEDLLKIYGFKKSDYDILEPFIVIPDTKKQFENTFKPYEKRKKRIVEINSADSVSLLALPYIGPSLTKRISKYKERLGGFHSKTQLMEVYGITPEIYSEVAMLISCDEKGVKQININNCTIDELKKHPYIRYNVAAAWVNYRKLHGAFKETDDLRKIDIINDSLYLKLKPYLKLHD